MTKKRIATEDDPDDARRRLHATLDRLAKQIGTLDLSHIPLTDDHPTWRDVAMGLGEDLASVGPDGYDRFTPQEWLEWALAAIAALKNQGSRPS